MKNKERIAILETEISRLKVANRTANERLEAIEGKLGIEVQRPARSAVVDAMLNRLIAKVIQRNSESNSSEIPNTCEPITPDFIPDWKDAPEDAVCVAMDGNGDWFWWDKIPTCNDEMWCIMDDKKRVCCAEATNAHLLPPDYWKSTLMMRPDAISDAPDYTHLLPEGYEFCQEADAEKWVKVEMKDVNDNDEYPIGHIDNFTCFKGRWRPIRPIQYKVTTHEIVTAVPDPYMPDWSKAPEGTVAHAWDEDGQGFWYMLKMLERAFTYSGTESHLTLPADLDWKQSLRVKPN